MKHFLNPVDMSRNCSASRLAIAIVPASEMLRAFSGIPVDCASERLHEATAASVGVLLELTNSERSPARRPKAPETESVAL